MFFVVFRKANIYIFFHLKYMRLKPSGISNIPVNEEAP